MTLAEQPLMRLLLSRSSKPFLAVIGLSLTLILIGLIFNYGPIGSVFGTAFGALDIRTDPIFVFGLVAISFIGRPWLTLGVAIIFSCAFQIYLSEFTHFRQELGLGKLEVFSIGRTYGGILLVSFLGLGILAIRKLIENAKSKAAS